VIISKIGAPHLRRLSAILDRPVEDVRPSSPLTRRRALTAKDFWH